MSLRKFSLLATIAAACGGAMANVSVSTVGPITTFTENFDGGTSFSAGWLNTLLNPDDYLFLTALAPTSSYSFSSAAPLASLSLSFWYSVPASGNGYVSIAGSGPIALADTPGNAAQYALNNPGPNNSTGFLNYNSYDAYFSTTLNNLAAGSYTVNFSTPGLLTSLKVDDVTITAVAAAVPEPETYALMLAGLGVVGWMGKRGGNRRAAA